MNCERHLHAEKCVLESTHSQTVLIKCLLKQSHALDKSSSSLKLFNKWLNSQNHDQSGHGRVITQKDIAFIIKEIENYFDSYEYLENDGKKILLDTIHSIINNTIFQQYFRHHPETYCDILSVTIIQMQNSTDVLNLLRLSSSFFKSTAVNSDFLLYFLKTLFTPLVTTCVKFPHDTDIFTETSIVLQRCLLNKALEPSANSENIEVKDEVLRVFKAILSFYNDQQFDLAKISYKLLFQSVCNLHNKNFKAIYNFFVFLVDNLGFNVSDAFSLKNSLKLQKVHLSFSLQVLADAINVLTNQNCSLDCTINKLNFSDFLKNILSSVMKVAIFANLQVYSIIHSIVSINPLIIEQNISNILAYLMINPHITAEIQQNYENLMVSIFQVFSKLHRIEKLVSVMIRSVKGKLEANYGQETVSYNYVGKNDIANKAVVALPKVDSVLSNAVLLAFYNSIISLLSWQVINIFKTLNFHFAETLQVKEDEKFYCYVEILSALFCCFLRSVRVAEHTVSSTVQEKFNKALEDLKLNLTKFGEVLLNKEHNHVLMRAYLNICFTYGETCIMLSYYTSDINNIAAKVEDSDYSLCNLVYLHNYLSREQWCIIAQRITNFGEMKCKHIMNKLYLQKLKAMHTFKATFYADTKQSFIKDDALQPEEALEALLQEPFFLNNVIPEMNHQSILSAAQFVFKTCLVDNNNLAQNQLLINCSTLIRGVLYYTMLKISKLFKHKHKCNDKTKLTFAKEFLSKIEPDLFICGNEISEAHKIFSQNLKLDWDKTSYKLDEEKLDLYLNVIKQLPILHMPATVQDVLLLFLLSLLYDCKGVLQKHHAEENLELIVTGLLLHNPGALPRNLPFNKLFSKIIPLFDKWDHIFIICLQWTMKNMNSLQKLQDGINYILNLDKNNFLKHAVVFLNVTNEKTKKARLCQESKKLLIQYRLQISEKIVSILDSKNVTGSLEAYGLVLKFYLSQDKPKSLNKIEDMLVPYVDYATSNLSNDSLLLLVTVLHNKSCLKEVEESLPFKIWLAAKQAMVTDASDSKNHLQLYMLIFGHVNDEEFTLITNDLFEVTKQALQCEEVEKYLYYLEIWSSILACCFKPTKTKLWQGILDKLLKEQREYLSHNSNASAPVIEETGRFQQKLIQAVQVPLTTTMIDAIILTPSTLLISTNGNFSSLFSLGISIMEFLLKQRNSLIMDRLPMYLQQYRYLLQQLCAHGNCDLKLSLEEIQTLADCAHMLEKLTNMLIQNRKHVTRVAPYLIADYLNIFEQFSLPSNIRVHLNNCFYGLISLCDQHAVSFLMRVLSTASTEMFKIMFEHYKKHYRFTGKV